MQPCDWLVVQRLLKQSTHVFKVGGCARGSVFHLVTALQDGEISLFGDATHLQEIMDSLHRQATDPNTLPAASEQVIADVTGSSAHWVCPVRSRQSINRGVSIKGGAKRDLYR